MPLRRKDQNVIWGWVVIRSYQTKGVRNAWACQNHQKVQRVERLRWLRTLSTTRRYVDDARKLEIRK